MERERACSQLPGSRKSGSSLRTLRKKGLIEVNLAQHVRIRKSKTSAANKVASSANVVELTPEGHAQIEAQLSKLKAERIPLTEQISSAAADGDVRENAPLEAAREQLGYLEGRIKDMEATLKASVIIDPSAQKTETVVLGSKVVVRDPAKRQRHHVRSSPRKRGQPSGRQDIERVPGRPGPGGSARRTEGPGPDPSGQGRLRDC